MIMSVIKMCLTQYQLILQLLHDQVGVVQFDQYKSVFMQTMQAAKSNFVALPSLPPLSGYPLRNW